MGDEKGIYCIKHYGNIVFVQGKNGAYCPISGSSACVDCDVIPKEEATELKQVKTESEKK